MKRFSCCSDQWDGLCVEEAQKCGSGSESCADRCTDAGYDITAQCQCDRYCVEAGDCCDDLCTECLYDKAEICIPNGGLWGGVDRLLAKTAYGNTVGVIADYSGDLDGKNGASAALNVLIDHIAKGADVNAKDGGGYTPLDWSIRRKHPETADLLRKHGGKTGEELKAEGK